MKIFKGWIGEKKTTFNMWVSLDSNTYPRIHDLILPSRNGTTQIDHVVVSIYGIFIIETKNIQGWIFGSPENSKWTQALGKKKFSFQNPLHQTYRQKKVLASFLNIPESSIHAVVYFTGDCKFKTKMPNNVLKFGLARYIKGHRNLAFSEQEVEAIISHLKSQQNNSNLRKKDHLQSLKDRHESSVVCPKCGGRLVLRMARQGSNAGSTFLGCSNYPKCRFTKNA